MVGLGTVAPELSPLRLTVERERFKFSFSSRNLHLFSNSVDDYMSALLFERPFMLSRSTISLLQQAGESLYAAQQAMAQEVRSGAQSVVDAVASLPFSAEADRAYAQLRTMARLSHELQAIEEQLRTAYQTAASLTQNDLQLLQALPLRRSPQILPVQQSQAEDAVVKPPRAKGLKASSKTKTKTQSSRGLKAQSLSSNDEKVLTYLERELTQGAWTQMTQASIAEGAGIPKGSIAVAISRLKQIGRLKEGARGHYRLK